MHTGMATPAADRDRRQVPASDGGGVDRDDPRVQAVAGGR